MPRVKWLFTPPRYPDDEAKTRTARLLNTLLFITLVMGLVLGLGARTFLPNMAIPLPFTAAVTLAQIALLILMRSGHVRLASWIWLVAMWTITMGGTAVSGSVSGPMTGTMVLGILIAGLLLGGRASVIFAVLSLVGGTGMFLAQEHGLLPAQTMPFDASSSWSLQASQIAMVTFLLYISITSLDNALGRAKQNEQVAAERNRELQAVRISLEEQSNQLHATVRQYADHMARVAGGDLSTRLVLDGHDTDGENPLAGLGQSLNETTASLQQMTVRIRDTAGRLSTSAAGILSAATQQAAGTSAQSAAIARTSSAVDEMRLMSAQMSEQAQTVTALAQRTAEVSQSGQQAVAETSATIEQIRENVEMIQGGMQSLSSQAQAIRQIIVAVKEVADQSNMLALNAAVEAARAGRAGKSFTVVANEVRNLAGQSQLATEQVQEILVQVSKGISTAAAMIEEGTKKAITGVQAADGSKVAIRQLADSVLESTQAAGHIATMVVKQQAEIAEIAQTLQDIYLVATQNLASSQQSERSAEELNTLAGQLRQLVQQYKL